jgi:hypothetical protein
VKVLSGKQVPRYIAASPAKLSEKTIAQIAYQLEQRCRDVRKNLIRKPAPGFDLRLAAC